MLRLVATDRSLSYSKHSLKTAPLSQFLSRSWHPHPLIAPSNAWRVTVPRPTYGNLSSFTTKLLFSTQTLDRTSATHAMQHPTESKRDIELHHASTITETTEVKKRKRTVLRVVQKLSIGVF